MAAEKRKCSPNCYQFFKVLFHGFSKKMLIPTSFMRAVFEEKCEWKEATITTTSAGRKWRARVNERRSPDGAQCYYYLADGWPEFVEAHGLRFGYFLVFDHLGGMDFHVTVFDHTGCSKTYLPLAGGDDGGCDSERLTDESADEFARKPKVAKTEEPEMVERNHVVGLEAPVKKKKKKRPPALADSQLMKSQFTITISPLNAARKCCVHIPAAFVKQNRISGVRHVVLSDSEGRRWPVELRLRRHGGYTRVDFGSGWWTFQTENSLRGGDACVFKLLSEKKGGAHFSTEVVRVRSTERSGISTSNASAHTFVEDNAGKNNILGAGTVECAKEENEITEHLGLQGGPQPTVPEISKFALTINYRNRRQEYMHIPNTFVKKNDISGSECAVLSNTKGCWPVKLHHFCCRGSPTARLGCGWRKFQRENRLRVGDKCVFQLQSLQNSGVHFSVTVSKQEEVTSDRVKKNSPITEDAAVIDISDDDISTSPPAKFASRKPKLKEDRIMRICTSLGHTTELTDAMKQEHSEMSNSVAGLKFTVVLKLHNLTHRGYLSIPCRFEGAKYFGGRSNVIIEGRHNKQPRASSWSVRVYRFPSKPLSFRLMNGWHAFCCDQGLEVGDQCTFELTPSDEEKKDLVIWFEVLRKKEH